MINFLNDIQKYKSVKWNLDILTNKINILEKDLESSKIELADYVNQEEILKVSIDLQYSEILKALETAIGEEKASIERVIHIAKTNLWIN